MAPRKTPQTNPQTREWSPENDCCNRAAAAQAHSKGCINNPINTKPEPKSNPDKSAPKTPRLVTKPIKEGRCTFAARGRNYVEGVMLEDSGQHITLSPAASYRQRNNRNLELIEGTIPVLPEDAPARPPKGSTQKDVREFKAYEESFIDSLDDGDPTVGASTVQKEVLKNSTGQTLLV